MSPYVISRFTIVLADCFDYSIQTPTFGIYNYQLSRFIDCVGRLLRIQFAGPSAQDLLDPVMIPCPRSRGCAGVIDPLVQVKDYAFSGASVFESVPTTTYYYYYYYYYLSLIHI